MAKNDNPTNNITNANDPTSKIDAIKQLIFGENIQEYNHEFEAVKKTYLTRKKS